MYLRLGLLCAGLLEGGLDEASDAVLVDACERIKVEQTLIDGTSSIATWTTTAGGRRGRGGGDEYSRKRELEGERGRERAERGTTEHQETVCDRLMGKTGRI